MIIMYQFSRSKTMPPFSSRDLMAITGGHHAVTMGSPCGTGPGAPQELGGRGLLRWRGTAGGHLSAACGLSGAHQLCAWRGGHSCGHFAGRHRGWGWGDGGRGGCGGFLLVSFLFGLGRCHADEGSDFWRWTDELGLKKFTCAAPSTMQQLQGKFLASGSSSGHVVLQLGLPTYCCLNCF